MSVVSCTLATPHLDLVAGVAAQVRAEIHNRFLFSRLLGVHVPSSWPPPCHDADTQAFHLDQLERHPDQSGWWTWYFVLRPLGTTPRTLIGTGGFKGPPDSGGVVEVGYSLLPEFQHHGYATEALAALTQWAFSFPKVTRIFAETLPNLTPSIRLLERLGFAFLGPGSAPGVIRYALHPPRL